MGAFGVDCGQYASFFLALSKPWFAQRFRSTHGPHLLVEPLEGERVPKGENVSRGESDMILDSDDAGNHRVAHGVRGKQCYTDVDSR